MVAFYIFSLSVLNVSVIVLHANSLKLPRDPLSNIASLKAITVEAVLKGKSSVIAMCNNKMYIHENCNSSKDF